MSDVLMDPNGTSELNKIVDLLMADHRQLRDELEAHELLEEGLPTSSVVRLVDRVGILSEPENLEKVMGISDDVLQRYQVSSANTVEDQEATSALSLEQSNRIWRFAEVLTKATEVMGSQELAEEWLVRPAMALNRHRPLDLLNTEAGFEMVDDLLIRLEYGVYT